MDRDRYDVLVQHCFPDDSSDPRRLDLMRGPPSSASLAAAITCLRENPNLASQVGSGDYLALERSTIAQLADLIFGSDHNAAGLITAGGTISNLYGAKIGLQRVIPDAMRNGIQGQRIAGIASEASHFCNRTIAGWLGLGSDNLHRVPTNRDCSIRLDLLESTLDDLYERGDRIAFVIGTFGTTDTGGIDDLAGMRKIIDAKAKQYDQPKPQLHADAAIGWVHCFLNDPRCEGLRVADSITLDFHKLGRAPYPSSAFLVRDSVDLEYLARSPGEMPYFEDSDDPVRWTLETSRSGLGAATARANLDAFSHDDWRMLTERSFGLAKYLKQRLEDLDHCIVLNRAAIGPSVVWWVLPKGDDAEAALIKAERIGRVPEDIRTLFELHQSASKIRLGFTTDIGYRPYRQRLPAWKANFFHPRTTEVMIDELIESIHRLGK